MVNKLINKLKLETKYVLFLILVFFVLLAIVIGVSNFIMRMFEKNIYSLNAENLNRIAYILDSHIDNIELYGDNFLTDSTYQEELAVIADTEDKALAASTRRQLNHQLSSRQGASPYVTDVSFVFPSGEVIHSGSGYLEDPSLRSEAEALALKTSGRPVWVSDTEGSIYYVRDLRRIKFLKLDHLAFLYLKVDFEKIIHDLNQYNSSDFLIILYNKQGELFSNINVPQAKLDDLEPIMDGQREYVITDFNKRSYLVSGGELNDGNWQYLNFFDNTDVAKSLSQGFILLISGIALLLVLSWLLIHLITRNLLRHFLVLKDKMEAFSSGALDLSTYPDYSERGDEIGILHQEFDKMVQRYDELITDNYIKQIMIKDNQIQMLNQQINPHFLYNVLDSIYWSAQCYGAEDIAQMAYSLAKLFRISTATDSIVVTVSQEVEYLDYYLVIQKIRFSDHLTLEKDIEEACLDTQLPRLSIQPLVENAIKHSIQTRDVFCAIKLSIRHEDEEVIVTVSNTGSTFPSNIQDIVNQKPEGGKHIGLRNIRERLLLIYGDKARMEFSNGENEAIVKLTLPWQGEINVQSLDS